MATQKETVDFILEKLGHGSRFTVRAMFGEYALYADGAVVALVCDNLLYVKILEASRELASLCEPGQPYPGAKDHHLIEEVQLSRLQNLPAILFAVAAEVKTTKAKPARAKKTAGKSTNRKRKP